MFDVPQEVLTIYNGAVCKEDLNIPIDRELEMIRVAWRLTIDTVQTASDLKNMWATHKQFLFQLHTDSSRVTPYNTRARANAENPSDADVNTTERSE